MESKRHRKLLLLLLLFITFMQVIYSYVPGTNHVSRACSVAAALYLQFMLHVMLFLLVKCDLTDLQVTLSRISEFR